MHENIENKIFIAEDDPVTSLMLKATLEKWGFDPETTDNGKEALEALSNFEQPIVVILDWQMPGMDGIDIVRHLREHSSIPHYIIMLTSRTEKSDIISSLDAGADNFISKPFDPDELKAQINVGIRMIKMHHELTKAVDNANRLADFIAHFDQTTGLPNRVFFTEKVKDLITSTDHGTLMLVNIDRFKIINQTKGLDIGDLLLNYFGVRLQECFETESVIARIAADEFGILVRHSSDCSTDQLINYLQAYSERIHSRVSEEFPVDDGIKLTVSIGAAPVIHDIAHSAEEFLRRADTALRLAKTRGGNQTVIHDIKMEEEIRHRYMLEHDLASAIENDQLELYLQAQIDTENRFIGAESLLRWEHPQLRTISPGIFIPIAEETDLIIGIGRWVIDKACGLLKQYEDETFTISVNISPRHFSSSSFVADVKYYLDQWNISGHRLILEITEGLLINEIDEVVKKMTELAAVGIHFSIDDFGTGYSSLSYLKTLPISEIKIDRAFIKGLPHDENNAAIVRAIFLMARALDLEVVAEGVETEEQAEFLNRTGKPLHQGFLFSRPAPAQDVLREWLKKNEKI